jgi:dTDP-glucose 4,6-dehydratase
MNNSIQYKTILVTGGLGFIGSNFVRHMLREHPECTIVNYDVQTYAGNPENLKDIEELQLVKPELSRRYLFIRGDICDPLQLDEVFSQHRFDAVINFAAESHVDRSIVSSYNFMRANIMGVHNLIEIARKYETKRFVQISTDEIYGDVEQGASAEDSPLRPSNPYAASKAAADLLVQSYMRTHSLSAVIVRGSNNFGCYQYPEKLIPLVITNLLDNKKIPIHGNGQQQHRWIHVEDFCSAIDVVLHKAPDFEIYNAAGNTKKNTEIIQEVCAILGKDFNQFCTFVGDRPGGDARYAPESVKIYNQLGWRPQKSIDTHLKEVVDWYISHEPWWRVIKQKQEFVDHYDRQSTARYY